MDLDIERLRRARPIAPEENGQAAQEEGYRAFFIAESSEPQRRLVIRSASLRRQIIPLYDLLYNVVTDMDGRLICLIYPFMTIKIHGRHLGELGTALTWHLPALIVEFDPASDHFPKGLDEESIPIVDRIVIERAEDEHGMDADEEAREFSAIAGREE